MELLKGIGILLLAAALSYWFSKNGIPLDWYLAIIGEEKTHSGFLADYAVLGESLFNLIVNYAFFVSLFFSSITIRGAYWWRVMLLIPIIVLFLWMGIGINVPLIVTISFVSAIFLGWGIGFGIAKLLALRTKGS